MGKGFTVCVVANLSATTEVIQSAGKTENLCDVEQIATLGKDSVGAF